MSEACRRNTYRPRRRIDRSIHDYCLLQSMEYCTIKSRQAPLPVHTSTNVIIDFVRPQKLPIGSAVIIFEAGHALVHRRVTDIG